MQLFCFPCAGGTSDFFKQLAPRLSPAVEVELIEKRLLEGGPVGGL